MNRFVQIHALTSYPPSNPNRDDQGRPKSAVVGGVPRLRISSQALKRAMRRSTAFQTSLSEQLGDRTRKIGDIVMDALIKRGHDEAKARTTAKEVAFLFGKVNDAKKDEVQTVRTNQLVFVSPEEREKAIDVAERTIKGDLEIAGTENSKGKKKPNKEIQATILNAADRAVDIAMFGRMLADAPSYNRDASVQVGHAFTTHAAVVEDDYFTAVDDLQTAEEEEGIGAGMIGEQGFGSGVYYAYANINLNLLLRNLGLDPSDTAIAEHAVEAFVEAMATACPTGKQNSFANHPRAGYLRVEVGDQQPRDLSGAFVKPVTGVDLMRASIDALEDTARRMDKAYGACADRVGIMDVDAEAGDLASLKALATSAFRGT